MGVLDSTSYLFTCSSCNVHEIVTILDKGSRFGGSHWQKAPTLNKFDVEWSEGGITGPKVQATVCKTCKLVGNVTFS